MSVRTVAAFLAGALAASAGTAAALTGGHVFRLQQGDEARYGTIRCEAVYLTGIQRLLMLRRAPPLLRHLRAG